MADKDAKARRCDIIRSHTCPMLLIICLFISATSFVNAKSNKSEEQSSPRQILVFGGNGFLGASTVERLVKRGDNVTIVNRGNRYWDSYERIQPFVNATIICDRTNNLDSCNDLVELVNASKYFDAVVDFSAYGEQETREATALLHGKVGLYVLISKDSVYDVCELHKPGPIKEKESVRPEDPAKRKQMNSRHQHGHNKMQAEEELIKQRSNFTSNSRKNDGSIPYLILRLPDVLGTKDTTHRFWMYQLWLRLAPLLPHVPVTIPDFLVDRNNSFVYVEDVATAIVDATSAPAGSPVRKKVRDEIYNLAWSQSITLEQLLREMELALGGKRQEFRIDNTSTTMYLYPTTRRGMIDVTKATKRLGWKPMDWRKAVHETVLFYEKAITDEKYNIQMNEIVQIQVANLYPNDHTNFYNAMEKAYGVDLKPFRRDEL